MTRDIFVHDLANPPAEDRNCDVELTLVGSEGRIMLTKQEIGLQTKYLLKVPDANSIGLASFDQMDVDHGIRDLVLAFNLSLERACISTMKGEMPRPEIQIRVPENPVRIEHTPEGVHVLVTETMVARDFVHITVGTKEELDEEKSIATL